MWYISYVVKIESSWSPSNSTASPSNSIGSLSNSTVYRPAMSTTPTDLEDIGKNHNSIHVYTQYVNVHMTSSDSIRVGLPY